jgi:hypothetical protein
MVYSNTSKEAKMPLGPTSRQLGVLLGLFLTLTFVSFLLPPSAGATTPDIQIKVSDTSANAGSQIPVTIFFSSGTPATDSVEAYAIWLKLDRPDIAHFHYTLSSGVARGKFDTLGTLTRGFEYLDVRSTIGDGLDMLITAIANNNGGPSGVKPPIPPHRQNEVLIKLYLDILNISDTVSDRTININVEKHFLDKFVFSRPDGTAIGFYEAAVTDTVCYNCLQWVGGICTIKQKVTCPGELSEVVLDTITLLDTTKVVAYNGSVVLTAGCCVGVTGNVNGAGIVDLADLSSLVSYLTGGGYTPPCLKEANVNAVGIVDLADLSALVSYLTGGGFVLPTCP